MENHPLDALISMSSPLNLNMNNDPFIDISTLESFICYLPFVSESFKYACANIDVGMPLGTPCDWPFEQETPMVQEAEYRELECPRIVDEEPLQVSDEKEEYLVETRQKSEEEINHDIDMGSLVREPVVDTKTWAPPLFKVYENQCFECDVNEFMHIEDLSPLVENFHDEPILEPLLAKRVIFEDLSMPENCRYAFIDNDLSLPIFVSNTLSLEHERYLLETLGERKQEVKESGPFLVLLCEELPLEENERVEGNKLMENHDHMDIIHSLFRSCPMFINFDCELVEGKCILALENFGASRHNCSHLPYEYEDLGKFNFHVLISIPSSAYIGKRLNEFVVIVFDRGK